MVLPSVGLNISTSVITCCTSAVAFMTEALITATSPVRRKRGRLGCTIISLEATTSREKLAERSESVNASARNPQVVLASGTVNFSSRRPSLSVTSEGRKNASGTFESRYVKTGAFSRAAPPSESATGIASAAASSTVITSLCSRTNPLTAPVSMGASPMSATMSHSDIATAPIALDIFMLRSPQPPLR